MKKVKDYLDYDFLIVNGNCFAYRFEPKKLSKDIKKKFDELLDLDVLSAHSKDKKSVMLFV